MEIRMERRWIIAKHVEISSNGPNKNNSRETQKKKHIAGKKKENSDAHPGDPLLAQCSGTSSDNPVGNEHANQQNVVTTIQGDSRKRKLNLKKSSREDKGIKKGKSSFGEGSRRFILGCIGGARYNYTRRQKSPKLRSGEACGKPTKEKATPMNPVTKTHHQINIKVGEASTKAACQKREEVMDKNHSSSFISKHTFHGSDCDNVVMLKDENLEALKLWDTGKLLGVSCAGNEEKVINRMKELEKRDASELGKVKGGRQGGGDMVIQ